jgi:hypothetical protein
LKKTSWPSAAHQRPVLPPHVTQISDSMRLAHRRPPSRDSYLQVSRRPRHDRSVGVNISHDLSPTRSIPSSCTAFCGIFHSKEGAVAARQSFSDRSGATLWQVYCKMTCRRSINDERLYRYPLPHFPIWMFLRHRMRGG